VFNTSYHLFQASWTPNSFTFYVDGMAYHSENVNNDASWPFNEAMFFIMNIAVGGNWPGNPNSTTIFPQNLLIDYVRVYHLTGPTSNEIVSFFASANNKFVSAENAGASPLDCSRTVASTWEQFLVVDLGANKIALQSQANGMFVEVTSNNGLIADTARVTPAATFNWTPNADGTVYLKSLANGNYLTLDTTVSPAAVVASATATSTPEAFGITCYGQLAGPAAPATPSRISASAGRGSAELAWSPVPGATSYQIYASSLPGGSGMAPFATVREPSFIASKLNPGTTYSFAVTAVNGQGMSLRSQVASTKPLPW
jgi:hypothetical protein